MKVAVYHSNQNTRSGIIGKSFAAGLVALGEKVVRREIQDYRGVEADAAVFYGMLQGPMKDYPAAGKSYVYIDLGYWGRLSGGKFDGYHKVSVNARHPNTYFQKVKHDRRRLDKLPKVVVKPWRKNGMSILIAGMGEKGSNAIGYPAESWERQAVKTIRSFTDRPIVYRPKPNWKMYKRIEGCSIDWGVDLVTSLSDVFAVVSHHSNAAVESLMEGVPNFCWEGVAVPQSLQDLSRIALPKYLDTRQQWAQDISYCQWSVNEMAEGLPWRHLRDEGLV